MLNKYFNLITRSINPKKSIIKKINGFNVVFIHINKTGGTSIIKALKISNKWHLTLSEIQSKINITNVELFTVVRNPWDKVASHYKYRLKTNQNDLKNKDISFNDWVKIAYKDKNKNYYDNPKMFQQQVNWIKDLNGEINPKINILRFENLEKEFKSFTKKLDLNLNLPHLNKTKKVNYSSLYNEESIEIISNSFKDDISTFNYKF